MQVVPINQIQNYNAPQFKGRLPKKQVADLVQYAQKENLLPELKTILKQLKEIPGKKLSADIYSHQWYNQKYPKHSFILSSGGHKIVEESSYGKFGMARIYQKLKNACIKDTPESTEIKNCYTYVRKNQFKDYKPLTERVFNIETKKNKNVAAEEILNRFARKDEGLRTPKQEFGFGCALDLELIHGAPTIVVR